MKTLFDNNGTPFNLLQESDIEIGNNANGRYAKFPKIGEFGLLVQWGTKVVSGASDATIYFPTTFYGDEYSVQATLRWHDINDQFVIGAKRDNLFSLTFFNRNSQGQWVYHNGIHGFDWLAIGIWK